MNIQDYLIKKGYIGYRAVFEKNNLVFKKNTMGYFSTMVNGGLDIRYVKDSDFKNAIIYGLNERGKPPTLVYPRPKIYLKKYCEVSKTTIWLSETMDDAMNYCLYKESFDDIFKAMFNKNIVFEYDLSYPKIT